MSDPEPHTRVAPDCHGWRQDEDDNASRRSRDSTGSRKRKAGGSGGHQGGGVGELDFLGGYDDDDSLAGVSIKSGGGGGKRSSSRASHSGVPTIMHLPLPSLQVPGVTPMAPSSAVDPNVPMLLGTADNPVMQAFKGSSSSNRRNATAAAGRKPQDESKVRR